MLTAYFDERNITTNEVAIVAGWLAPVRKWQQFSNHWTKLLFAYHINPKDFHRTDLQFLRCKFSSWDKARRDNFLDEAYKIIRNHGAYPVAHAVKRSEFKTIVPRQLKERVGGVYGWCAYGCLQSIKCWCNDHGHKQPIQLVFECGAKGSGQVIKFLNDIYNDPTQRKEFRLGTFTFAGKGLKPLHAADMIAYDVGRWIEQDDRYGHPTQDVHTYLINLLGKKRPKALAVKYWAKANLQSFVAKLSDASLFS